MGLPRNALSKQLQFVFRRRLRLLLLRQAAAAAADDGTARRRRGPGYMPGIPAALASWHCDLGRRLAAASGVPPVPHRRRVRNDIPTFLRGQK
jgi:hypothetical protein